MLTRASLALLPLLAACAPSAPEPLYAGDANLLLGTGPAAAPAPATAPMEGVLFISPLKSRFSYLLDGEGNELHKWESPYFPGAGVQLQEDGSLLRCGRLVDPPTFVAGGQGGRLQRIAWDGTLLWDFEFSTESHLHHHDATMMPNGHVLLIAWERLTKEDALARGRDPELQKDEEFWPDWVLEIVPEGATGGKIVWEWHAWDHVIQDYDKSKEFFGEVAAHPELIDINGDRPRVQKTDEEKAAEAEKMAAVGYAGDTPPPPPPAAAPAEAAPPVAAAAPADGAAPAEGAPPADGVAPADGAPPADGGPPKGPPGRPGREADWMHSNSIAYHPELDLIALSVRRFSEAWVIDHSTTTAEAATHAGGRHGKGGDLLYRWGNPRAHGAGGDADQKLFVQHHVQWVPQGFPGAGNFICFNNGEKRADGDYSSIEEWRMPITADGRITLGPAEPVWRYVAEKKEDFFSPFISGVQRLPNGSTLITEGITGRLLEVASDGKIVWEWTNTYGGEEEPKDDGPSARVPPKAQFRAFKYPPTHPVARMVAGR